MEELREHKVLIKHDKNGNEICAIEWLTESYKGIIFIFDKVEFVEQADDTMRVKFNYDVLREPEQPYEKEDLIPVLGDFLMAKVAQQLADNELIYSGGTNVIPRPERDE